jgi:hypothetical protein
MYINHRGKNRVSIRGKRALISSQIAERGHCSKYFVMRTFCDETVFAVSLRHAVLFSDKTYMQ